MFLISTQLRIELIETGPKSARGSRGSHRWPGWEGLRHWNHIVPCTEDGAMKGTYRKEAEMPVVTPRSFASIETVKRVPPNAVLSGAIGARL
jgi:hypothetical protein